MKPWLLNILACPIDKHHPLEAYFYKWETPEAEIEKIAKDAGNPSKELEDKYRIMSKQIGDGTISPPSISIVKDLTGSKMTKDLLERTVNILSTKDKKSKEELDLLQKYLNLLEVEQGLLVCPECGRWYPIGCAVEGIPELMPDELRESEVDLKWLDKWKEVVPEVVKKEGKPFHL